MNDKHSRFVDEYLVDQNATRAATAAGYSKKTAKSQGSRLLTNVDILRAIRKRQEQPSSELNVSAADKRRKLWEIAQFCGEAIEGPEGERRMRDPRAATAAIAELNKMDGEYRQSLGELPQVTFIQHFGSDACGLKNQELTVTRIDEE